jgi:predicted phosphodiesterase
VTLADDAAELEAARTLDRAYDAAAKLRRDLADARRRLKVVQDERDSFAELAAIHDVVAASNPRPPRWMTPKRPGKGHRGTLVLLLSDTHWDEVVDPGQMSGMNAYDRPIAELRLKRWAERVVMLARDYTAGVTLDGIVVLYGGDNLSGDIHEELRRTNADTLLGGLLHWQEQLAAALGLVADELKVPVHMAATFGNHPRTTDKPHTKNEARTNVDWVLAHQVARHFRGDDRFTFDIPEARDVYVTVYGTTHCLNHGNETTGGSGIGGIWPPIMRMKARKVERDMAYGRRWDVLCIGHWHQEIFAPQQGLIVNPAMKGYDEYARRHNFRPERPAQLAWLVTPEHGITDGRPIIVGDRKREGWG